jgi:hypothetical protein
VVFQNKTVPERQQIDVDIDVHTVEIHKKYRNNPQLYYEFMGHSGMMTFRISHTSRTWGSDIENLLSGHMKGLLIPEDKTLRSVVRKFHTLLWNIVALSAFSVLFLGLIAGLNWVASLNSSKYIFGQNDVNDPLDRIYHLLQFMTTDILGVKRAAFTVGITIIIGLGLAMCYIITGLLLEDAKQSRPSFVVLSRSAETARTAELRSYERGWRSFFWSFGTAVIAGVLGNITTIWIIGS